MHGRFSQRVDVNTAPYRDTGTTIGKGKKWTFKGRYEEKTETTPGCDYAPPAFGSDTTATTVHVKTKTRDIEVTPGPGQYDDNRKLGDNVPKISMHGPHDRSLAVRGTDIPGAGAYYPNMPQNKPNTPRYTIGRRFGTQKIEQTPGPGQYKLPDPIHPNSARGQIHVRLERNVTTDGPGPAEYDTQKGLLANLPKVHMHGRTQQKVDVTTAPYRNTRRSVSETPAYSMRSRYDVHKPENTPGVDYAPPAFGTGSRGATISPRYKDKDREVTPGPGQYKPVTSKEIGSARKSTFHGPSSRSLAPPAESPGPADYSSDINATKARAPRFTMKGARYDPKKDKSGEYVDLGSTLKGPRYSMRARPTLGVAFG